MSKLLMMAKNIYTGQTVIDSGFIFIEDGAISKVGTDSEIANLERCGAEVISLKASCSVIPGMIDLHIHGAMGADVMDGTEEALDTIARALPAEGTTSFLATTLTEKDEVIKTALLNAGQFIARQKEGAPSLDSPGAAEMLGIHLEGPFISKKRPGAHLIESILTPDIDKFNEYQVMAQNTIKLVTMAPELPGGLALVEFLAEHGVVASIGHSNANSVEVADAVEAGARHVTHLFNAMSSLHHREPGVVGAALLHKELLCELIVDGIHLHPNIVNLAYQIKGREGVVLVTDAIRAKCLGEGTYSLGEQAITVQGGKAFLPDGTLAGSVLTMKESVRKTIAYTGCSLADIVYLTATNPAKQIGLFDRKGTIEAGKDGDIVVLDEKLEVVMTFCRGKLAFSKKEGGYW